ncbi:Glyoxalase/bleomycin resistance protein/dioxygenase [Candidatus Koribacter versatilis Ellin345]|uniref:Glyoxalase/bleomycin resistance protein/dioxygenase n=1 Tax=Koribacter versatilis (strain Ellin345) TaxID=204669 RepID=Q1IRS4_KORVE|nr:VOC family protein [Candidatus Koribacter versatilis]ABF40426.1 Glyoxalase/bleomycin resistance protein/dioxygenase [Candidatus Koribacter versatilis Ellin345]
MSKVKPIPDGYHSVTPYLVIKGAKQAMEYYTKAFGAQEVYKMLDDKGNVAHAEIKIGNSMVMLAEEKVELAHKSPITLGGSAVSMVLYVDDCDAVFNRAVEAGGSVERPLTTQFYGDRSGGLKDPFGYVWYVSTHVEDVSPEEMDRRMKEQMKPA